MGRPGPSGVPGDGATVQDGRTASPPRLGVLKTLGRKAWPLLHGLSDRWPCRRCRPAFSLWMSGLHDAVNVRIGRNPFRPEAWDRFRSGELDGSVHFGCVLCQVARWAARFIAQVPRSRRPT
ncbi:MAG TPA: hypothetical protein VJ326_01740 [Thermoplasmata archaeon]|nr:hypothetical protein [Thermoplasmata archaeon]